MADLTPSDLRSRGSLKWTMPPENLLGAFVAESDLPMAPAIRAALDEALDRGMTGYLPEWVADQAALACAEFQQRRYGWQVDPAGIGLLPDVLTAMAFTADRLVDPGTPIVLPTPAYMPFLVQPGLLGRELRTVPMDRIGASGRYLLDPARLEHALRDGGLLLLVNPHNPTGQVATRAELLAVANVVERTGSTVFVDEIHAPMVYPGSTHVPYASISEAAARHSVTAVSASKAWNLPGLSCAQLVLTSPDHRRRWDDVHFVAKHGPSPLGAVAAAAAYSQGVEHLDACLAYLDAGRGVFAERIAGALPSAGYAAPEATYIHWLDLRPLGVGADGLGALVRERTSVVGTDGAECGAPGFLRLTLATSHPLIADIADRLARLAD